MIRGISPCFPFFSKRGGNGRGCGKSQNNAVQNKSPLCQHGQPEDDETVLERLTGGQYNTNE